MNTKQKNILKSSIMFGVIISFVVKYKFRSVM